MSDWDRRYNESLAKEREAAQRLEEGESKSAKRFRLFGRVSRVLGVLPVVIFFGGTIASIVRADVVGILVGGVLSLVSLALLYAGRQTTYPT